MLIPSAASAKFFHTPAGTGFVDLLINGNRETWPIRSKRFRTWLRRRHYEITRTAASAAAINSALDLLEAQAQFEGRQQLPQLIVKFAGDMAPLRLLHFQELAREALLQFSKLL